MLFCAVLCLPRRVIFAAHCPSWRRKIRRVAAPSLRYARLLRRYLRYPLPSFGGAAMTPCAVAALFLNRTARRVAVLPHCADLEFILNFKSASMLREI